MKGGEKHSDQFYTDLADFTHAVIQAGERDLSGLIAYYYSEYPGQNTHSELTFDLLVMGGLWRVYGAQAAGASGKMEKLLTSLADIRKRSELGHFYPEFVEPSVQCAFHNCSHIHEPDCGVQAAVGENKISLLRYENYQKIWASLPG